MILEICSTHNPGKPSYHPPGHQPFTDLFTVFQEWKLKQGSSEILRKLVISSLIHLQPLGWSTQLSVLLMCSQFQRHFVKFLNQEAGIADMLGFCSVWFVCLFVFHGSF